MTDVNVGIIGYGTIGMGTAQILIENQDIIEKRTGKKINLKKIADLDIETVRSFQVDKELLTTDVNDIINDSTIDIVVECIGGSEPARTFILKCLNSGKSIVTPNKEVIAKFGREIFETAKKNGVEVFIEAAVGGGIPIIRPLKMGLAANNIQEIYGIVNGTTNYILTKMADEGSDFDAVLKEAQDLGYAEADPTSDIEGYDSAYKLVILSSIAFEAKVDFENIAFEGITKISAIDNEYAVGMGYEIKLLAIGKSDGKSVELKVHPTMVPAEHPIAQIKGVNNAVYVKGDFIGETMYYGPGAGAEATGSAVVADIMDIVHSLGSTNLRNLRCDFSEKEIKPIGETVTEFYVRLDVEDRSGVLAKIATIFADNGISIKTAIQNDEDGSAELVLVTHEVKEKQMDTALALISKEGCVKAVCSKIRVGI